MSKFDPILYFEKEFDRIKADELRPSQHATIKPRLLSLLSRYRLKLQPAVHASRTIEAGKLLLRLGELEVALHACFDPVGARIKEEESLEVSEALSLKVQAELGAVEASHSLLIRRDAALLQSESAKTMRALIARASEAIGACLKLEKVSHLSWRTQS